MANQLQKLKAIINPTNTQMTGQVIAKVSIGVYRLRPLGQDVGFVVCTYAHDLKVGDRVYYKGGQILGVSPTTGTLSFVEV